MKYLQFIDKIQEMAPDILLKTEEPLSRHTSFRIGGPAALMAFPKNSEQLSVLLNVSKLLDCKTAIIGAGTNILAPDAGMQCLVICLKDCLGGMEQLDNTRIRVAAGVTMTRAAVYAAGLGLGGLEFAHGIPGTVGGGVYMNAGAYGGEISQVCESVQVMLRDGTVKNYSREEMNFSYRHSMLEDQGGIVLSAVFLLTPGKTDEIRGKMTELMAKRRKSQPLDKPSAGSAFKRPAQGYAAALIEDCGLKGFQVGDAAVSQKHAGFVVNQGHATAAQVCELLTLVAAKVRDKTGIILEPEVRIW